MDLLSAASFASLQIDFYRNEQKPQAAWKGRNQNKNVPHALENGRH